MLRKMLCKVFIAFALMWAGNALAWNTMAPVNGWYPEYNATAICRGDANNHYLGNSSHYWDGKFFGRAIWGRGSKGSNTGFNIGGNGIHYENGKRYYIGPRYGYVWVEDYEYGGYNAPANAICEIVDYKTCSFNGQTVAHGGSVTAYAASTVAFGGSCSSQVRSCNDGTLSGSYAYSSCAVAAPANCTFNGSTVYHGGSATAYLSSSVSNGSSCTSQSRSCYNGSLAGSYANSSCSVIGTSNRSLTTNEDTSATIALSVDTSVSGLTYTYYVSQPSNGTVSGSGATRTFTPNQDWNGSTSFTYYAIDSNGSVSDTSTVTVTVYAVNDAPVAQAKTLTVNEDTSGSVTLTATDIDSPAPTTFQIVSAPNSAHGTVSLSGNTATFTPVANWNGSTSFTYRAQDSSGAWSAAVTVSVTVTAVNDTPTVSSLTLNTTEDTAATITLPVSDPDLQYWGDSHTWSVVTAPNVAHGTASITGNKLTLTPAANWNGTTTLTYRARDAAGAYSSAATITVTVTAVNDKPIVDAVSASIKEDTSVTIPLSVFDVDLGFEGDSHAFEVTGTLNPTEGAYTFSGNKITMTPVKDWNGTLSLTYRAKDSHGVWSDSKSVSLAVTYMPDAPTSTGATIAAKEGMESDHVLPWVKDVDIPYGDFHTYSIEEQPSNGSAKVVYGRLEYKPNEAYFGEDSFKIRATDQDGLSVVGSVSVTVSKFNYAPTAITPAVVGFYAGAGGEASLSVQDPNTWGSHTLEVAAQPAHGQVTFQGFKLIYKTDGSTDSVVRVRAIDQGGLFYEQDITLKMRPISELFDGREVVATTAAPKVPAVKTQIANRSGAYALQVRDANILAALGDDVIAFVSPSSEVGVSLQHRGLTPGEGMRLDATKRTASYFEARLGGLVEKVDGTATILLSRLDMTGPVYSIPVHVWAPEGNLAADNWTIEQGVDKTNIRFVQTNDACITQTNSNIVRSKNVIQEPSCFLKWTQTPDQWKDTSNLSQLSMSAAGRTIGSEGVEARAYIYDHEGNELEIGVYKQTLNIEDIAGKISFTIRPSTVQAYEKVEELSLVLRQATGDYCEPITDATVAKKAAAQWQTNPYCYVQWMSVPQGLSQRATSFTPQLEGSLQVTGTNLISWRASVFAPNGSEIVVGFGQHEIEALTPPPVEIDMPSSNLVKEGLYWVSQEGGLVGSSTTLAIPATVEQIEYRDEAEVGRKLYPSYGRSMRITHYIQGVESPLWSVTPYSLEAFYSATPDSKTIKTVGLLAVPGENIRPVILNGEDQILDTQSLTVSAAIRNSLYPDDGYDLAQMGDWDIRLLMTTTGSSFQPLTDWEPINAEGVSQFEVALVTLTNKVVRIVAEARVRSPVPEYSLTRRSPYPLVLSVLNGDPLDGAIQSMRVIGPAPLRSSFYAITSDRYEARDLGAVRWEMSSDGGATWKEVSSSVSMPQRLTWIFERGSYLLRAELTNRHSGAKSMTPTIEVIAYVVPAARLKGPANVFFGDYGNFKLTDLAGGDLNTEDMIIEWSEDRGTTWTPGGPTYQISRDTSERVYLMARLKHTDSPDDKRVYKVLRAGVSFRPVRPPRVQIIGPRRPEVGKEAVWTANLMMPYPNMDLTMDGEFIMPTGEVVKALQVSYTPVQEDMNREETYIAVRSWINGYEDKGGSGITQHRLIFWEYAWPTWTIASKFTAEYAPAELSMTARSLGLFREFENLQMEWDIPPYPGLTVVKDTGSTSRVVNITEPGIYDFGVHISDDRGNYSYVETQLEFLEPIPWDVQLSWSGDNPANRAPLGVLIRPTITGGHPKDRISTRAYSLDGEPLEAAGEYGRATLPEEGVYTAKLDITTEMGHSASGSVDIPVNTNKSPTCELAVTPGRTSWLAKATCLDEDGRIVRHLWFVNGTMQAISSSSISVPMWRYPEGEPIITVVGVDDSGAESPPVASQ